MFCGNCGTPLEASAEFCPCCGMPAQRPVRKSRLAAGLLGLFLGWTGAHNFYLCNWSKAIAQLMITLVSLGTLGMISGIWGMVEGILLLCGKIDWDGYGEPLQ